MSMVFVIRDKTTYRVIHKVKEDQMFFSDLMNNPVDMSSQYKRIIFC